MHLDKFSKLHEIEEAFYTAYGLSIYEVESGWREALAAGRLSDGMSVTPTEPDREGLLLYGGLLFVGIFVVSFLVVATGERAARALARVLRHSSRFGKASKARGARNSEHREQHGDRQ
jgi:hypothetical protein